MKSTTRTFLDMGTFLGLGLFLSACAAGPSSSIGGRMDAMEKEIRGLRADNSALTDRLASLEEPGGFAGAPAADTPSSDDKDGETAKSEDADVDAERPDLDVVRLTPKKDEDSEPAAPKGDGAADFDAPRTALVGGGGRAKQQEPIVAPSGKAKAKGGKR